MRRMDRYNNDNSANTSSRRDKNEELYKEVNSNVKYTSISDVSNANAYDITNKNLSNTTSREDYHKLKEYSNLNIETKEKKQLDDFNYLYKDKENKIYDINTVIEEARKNRKEEDESESKRKLANTNYNILASLNKEELEKYRQEKKERIIPPDETEIREIIDTITSKTLAGDISKETSINLLSDLMATQALDRVAAQVSEENTDFEIKESKYKTEKEDVEEVIEKEKSKEVLKKEDLEQLKKKSKEEVDNTEENMMDKADTDFYTRSMDLSDKDFSMSEDFDEEPMPLVSKIILFLIVVLILAAAGFYIYTHYFK